MTGGLGFSRDGQSSYKTNRELRKNKAPFQTAKNNTFINGPELKFKRATKEEFQEFKAAFLKRKKRLDKLKIIGFIAFTILFMLFVWYVIL